MGVVISEMMSRAWLGSPMLTQCAWCGSVRRGESYSEERRPISPEMDGRRVTHGICPLCLDGVLGSRPPAATAPGP